jgi:hypothetical protein
LNALLLTQIIDREAPEDAFMVVLLLSSVNQGVNKPVDRVLHLWASLLMFFWESEIPAIIQYKRHSPPMVRIFLNMKLCFWLTRTSTAAFQGVDNRRDDEKVRRGCI